MRLTKTNHTRTVSSGFTIVELLIVIVVIAILATITIVTYNGIQNRAYDSAVQSDLSTLVKKLSTAAIDNSDLHIVPPPANLNLGLSKNAYMPNENNLYYCLNTTTNQYAVAARTKSGKQYRIVNGVVSENTGTRLYGADTCALVGVGTWGSSASLGYDSATQLKWSTWANS